MGRGRWVGLALLGMGLLAGCADPSNFQDIGIPFNANLVGYIQASQTTRGDVQAWFGNPTARVVLSDDDGNPTENTRYAYLHAHARQQQSDAEFLEVQFDENGRVTDVFFTESDDEPPDM